MPTVTKETAASVDNTEKVASQEIEDIDTPNVEPRKAEKIFRDLIQMEDELQSHGSSIRQLLAGVAKQLLGISVSHHAPTAKEIEIREAAEKKRAALAA